MGGKMKVVFAVLALCLLGANADILSEIEAKARSLSIIPDVVRGVNLKYQLEVTFTSAARNFTSACTGQDVTFPPATFVSSPLSADTVSPYVTSNEPHIQWPSDYDMYYTLMFLDPDAGGFSNYTHALYVNMPGNAQSIGFEVAP